MERIRLKTQRSKESFGCDWVVCDVDTMFQPDTKSRDTLFSDTFVAGGSVKKEAQWSIGITVEDGRLGVYLHLEKFEKCKQPEFQCNYTIEIGSAAAMNFKPVLRHAVKYTFTEAEGYGIPNVITVRELFTRKKELFCDNALQIRLDLQILSDPINSTGKAGEDLLKNHREFLTEAFSSSFESLLVTKKHSDLVIRCGERNFAVHKLILSARSPVLAEMIERTSAAGSNEILIKDASEDSMEAILRFIYTGKASIPTDSSKWEDVLRLADQFKLEDLKRACFEALVSNICDEFAGICAYLAFKFKAPTAARELVVDYCHENFGRLVKREDFSQILTEWPKALLKET